MIVEVRSYTVAAGRRDEFIEFFQTRAVPAQLELGMKLIGPLLDISTFAFPGGLVNGRGATG
jgi:hypothetical protein